MPVGLQSVISFIKKYWKPLAVMVACSACYLTGLHQRKTTTVTHTEYKDRIVYQIDQKAIDTAVAEAKKTWEKSNTQTVIVDVKKRPDGTVSEQTTTQVSTTQNSGTTSNKSTTTTDNSVTTDVSQNTDVKNDSKTTVAESVPTYSLGLTLEKTAKNWISQVPTDLNSMDFRVDGAMKLLGPIWGQVSYEMKSGQLGVGVRVEF